MPTRFEDHYIAMAEVVMDIEGSLMSVQRCGIAR